MALCSAWELAQALQKFWMGTELTDIGIISQLILARLYLLSKFNTSESTTIKGFWYLALRQINYCPIMDKEADFWGQRRQQSNLSESPDFLPVWNLCADSKSIYWLIDVKILHTILKITSSQSCTSAVSCSTVVKAWPTGICKIRLKIRVYRLLFCCCKVSTKQSFWNLILLIDSTHGKGPLTSFHQNQTLPT